jgi:hypothetical protein
MVIFHGYVKKPDGIFLRGAIDYEICWPSPKFVDKPIP